MTIARHLCQVCAVDRDVTEGGKRIGSGEDIPLLGNVCLPKAQNKKMSKQKADINSSSLTYLFTHYN